MIDIAKALQGVINKGRVGADGQRDSVLALLNRGEARGLKMAGGIGTAVPGTQGLVKQFRVGGSMGAGADGGDSNDRVGADAGGGGGGSSSGNGGTERTVTPAADPISANPNNPRTQNVMRSATNYSSAGATPYVADPSIGQLAGMFTSAIPGIGGINNLAGAGIDAADGGGFGDVYDGGALGQMIDKLFGSKPGAITGSTNPDAAQSSGNTRGDPLARIFSSNRASPTIFQAPDLWGTLINPKVYSSNDATIIR